MNSGALAGLKEGPPALARAAVHLAEDEATQEPVADDARRLDGRQHLGHASHHVPGPQDGLELLLVFHAVLDRQHARALPNDGLDGLAGAVRVERLDAEEDEVSRRQAFQVLDHGRADHPLAVDGRLHAEPMRPDGLEVRAARDEGNVLTRPRELGAEVSAGPARSHHDDAHRIPPRGSVARLSIHACATL